MGYADSHNEMCYNNDAHPYDMVAGGFIVGEGDEEWIKLVQTGSEEFDAAEMATRVYEAAWEQGYTPKPFVQHLDWRGGKEVDQIIDVRTHKGAIQKQALRVIYYDEPYPNDYFEFSWIFDATSQTLNIMPGYARHYGLIDGTSGKKGERFEIIYGQRDAAEELGACGSTTTWYGGYNKWGEYLTPILKGIRDGQRRTSSVQKTSGKYLDCFGYVGGKIYRGDRHHADIIRMLIDSGDYDWDDLETGTLFGWIKHHYNQTSEEFGTEPGQEVPQLYVLFNTDTDVLQDTSLEDDAVDAISKMYNKPAVEIEQWCDANNLQRYWVTDTETMMSGWQVGDVEMTEDEYFERYAAPKLINQVKFDVKGVGGLGGQRRKPVVYNPQTGRIFVGPNDASHYELVIHVPELEAQINPNEAGFGYDDEDVLGYHAYEEGYGLEYYAGPEIPAKFWEKVDNALSKLSSIEGTPGAHYIKTKDGKVYVNQWVNYDGIPVDEAEGDDYSESNHWLYGDRHIDMMYELGIDPDDIEDLGWIEEGSSYDAMSQYRMWYDNLVKRKEEEKLGAMPPGKLTGVWVYDPTTKLVHGKMVNWQENHHALIRVNNLLDHVDELVFGWVMEDYESERYSAHVYSDAYNVYDTEDHMVDEAIQAVEARLAEEGLETRTSSEYEAEDGGYVKYPRTYHLPWSPGRTEDDVSMETVPFEGMEVVVTEKLDGENTTMYSDHVHARSLDSKYHPTRTMVNKLHGEIAHLIPEGWRVVGENMQGQHSISYSLESPFYVFAIFDETNTCLSWEDTITVAQMLDLPTVPVLYRGQYNENLIRELDKQAGDSLEGYVVRNANAFPFEAFSDNVAKFVREDHVQTGEHWMNNPQFNDIKWTKIAGPYADCFGFVHGKLYIGNRHHADIIRRLIEEEGMDFDDFEEGAIFGWIKHHYYYDGAGTTKGDAVAELHVIFATGTFVRPDFDIEDAAMSAIEEHYKKPAVKSGYLPNGEYVTEGWDADTEVELTREEIKKYKWNMEASAAKIIDYTDEEGIPDDGEGWFKWIWDDAEQILYVWETGDDVDGGASHSMVMMRHPEMLGEHVYQTGEAEGEYAWGLGAGDDRDWIEETMYDEKWGVVVYQWGDLQVRMRGLAAAFDYAKSNWPNVYVDHLAKQATNIEQFSYAHDFDPDYHWPDQRIPVIYRSDNDTIYLGQPGSHHNDVTYHEDMPEDLFSADEIIGANLVLHAYDGPGNMDYGDDEMIREPGAYLWTNFGGTPSQNAKDAMKELADRYHVPLFIGSVWDGWKKASKLFEGRYIITKDGQEYRSAAAWTHYEMMIDNGIDIDDIQDLGTIHDGGLLHSSWEKHKEWYVKNWERADDIAEQGQLAVSKTSSYPIDIGDRLTGIWIYDTKSKELMGQLHNWKENHTDLVDKYDLYERLDEMVFGWVVSNVDKDEKRVVVFSDEFSEAQQHTHDDEAEAAVEQALNSQSKTAIKWPKKKEKKHLAPGYLLNQNRKPKHVRPRVPVVPDFIQSPDDLEDWATADWPQGLGYRWGYINGQLLVWYYVDGEHFNVIEVPYNVGEQDYAGGSTEMGGGWVEYHAADPAVAHEGIAALDAWLGYPSGAKTYADMYVQKSSEVEDGQEPLLRYIKLKDGTLFTWPNKLVEDMHWQYINEHKIKWDTIEDLGYMNSDGSINESTLSFPYPKYIDPKLTAMGKQSWHDDEYYDDEMPKYRWVETADGKTYMAESWTMMHIDMQHAIVERGDTPTATGYAESKVPGAIMLSKTASWYDVCPECQVGQMVETGESRNLDEERFLEYRCDSCGHTHYEKDEATYEYSHVTTQHPTETIPETPLPRSSSVHSGNTQVAIIGPDYLPMNVLAEYYLTRTV